MRLQDRNMIGGVSLQKNGASGILFQFVKDLIKYYKFKYIGHYDNSYVYGKKNYIKMK